MTDKEQFIKVLKENKRIIFKVINIYCNDTDDKKDLEQEIIIQLWKSFHSYDSNYKISTWIYRIAMNVSISFYRSNILRKTKTTSIHESIFQGFESGENEVESENKRLLQAFIQQLDEFSKQIIVLYFEEYNHKEIAEIVGISESNVGTKINRIKKKLQEDYKKLKQQNDGNGIR